MDKDLQRIIDIPEGITVGVDDSTVKVSGSGKELEKTFDTGRVAISTEGKTVKISVKRATRRESKMIGTIWAHINNMIKGMAEDFVYQLEVCNVHFPMNVKLEGDKIVIKSFLGENTQRISKVLPNVNVDIKGSKITVSSYNIEAAGQTAANLEKATKLTGRDRRIFQDGIFITEKCGRKI
jgi:large subunit ribosomal protein L6